MKPGTKVISKKTIDNKKVQAMVSPELDRATRIAAHYGFAAMPEVKVEKEDIYLAKKFASLGHKVLHPFSDKVGRFEGFLEEKTALIRNYLGRKFAHMGQPVMAYYDGPLAGNPHLKKIAGEETFNLEVLGSGKPIVDAMVIETAYVILKDRYGDEPLSVEINSMGDNDSISKFSRELSGYLRKAGTSLSKNCRQDIKDNVFKVYDCDHDECSEVQENAPKSMSFLSEQSREHFREVLEYLESLNIPYSVNHTLLGSRSFCSETIFQIVNKQNSLMGALCIGQRYNTLSRRILGKKETPAIGAALLIHPHFVNKMVNKNKSAGARAKFFFIQIGFDAKLKSLSLIESLRLANIPVMQSLSKDKLSMQLVSAEKAGIPYIIIMGQKEAMENSVVVRNTRTMSQETVPVSGLTRYLKSLK